MTRWSKAFSLLFGFMTPCGVSTGILSFGDGIVVGVLGGGSGIWGEFDKSISSPFFFFLSSFFSFPLSLVWGMDILLPLILIHISHG